MMTADELVLLALDNYRNRRIVSPAEQNKIFVFYVKEIHKKGLSADLYFSCLKPEIELWCGGEGILDFEKKHLLRKIREYLSQAKKRYRGTER